MCTGTASAATTPYKYGFKCDQNSKSLSYAFGHTAISEFCIKI